MDFPQLFAFKWVPMQGTLLFHIMFIWVHYPLKLFVSELVQEYTYHCLQAWQPHQREQDETLCCICCYHFMVMDHSVHCSFRNASCAPGPAASRAACGWICAHGGREAEDLNEVWSHLYSVSLTHTFSSLHHPLSNSAYPSWLQLCLHKHRHTGERGSPAQVGKPFYK